MPGRTTGVGDLGSQYKDYIREECAFRPVAGVTYTPGSLLQFVALDLQLDPDIKCVALPGTGANQQKLAGFVSEVWPGFSAPSGTVYSTGATLASIRGTLSIDAVLKGFHPGILLDCSGTGAVTVVDGLPLIASRATAGYVQGTTAASGPGLGVAVAALPGSGIGSSITAAALAQASQTATISGTPAVGDTLSVTIQTPYVSSAPGVSQTTTWTTPALTSAQATSTTTAAAALRDYLNSQANFSKFFTATASTNVVTVTVNTAAALFRVNGGSGNNITFSFDISLSGMIANSLSFACAATGGSTNTAGSTTLASGTGFKGYIPAWCQAAT